MSKQAEKVKEQEQTQVAVHEPTFTERFMNKVLSELKGGGLGDIEISNFQKRLVQNYCMAIDSSLVMAEEKRKKKSEKYRDPLPITWANVNMDLDLYQRIVSFARIGLDPMQKNHIAVMPFKNNTINKYDIVFIEEYRGIGLKAVKYGLDVPDYVIVELVYSNDKFKSYKKDKNNKYESYDFEIVDDFDRGEIKGGFYYHAYNDNPEKNRLVVFTLKEILKRKPDRASSEFWGGKKDVWQDGKKTGTEEVEGWYEKMCYKTVYRAAFNDITIDSQKIDDDYIQIKKMESQLAEARIAEEITENANKEVLDVEGELVASEDEDAVIVPGEDEPEF